MPHPENAVEDLHGSTDGRAMFKGIVEALVVNKPLAAEPAITPDYRCRAWPYRRGISADPEDHGPRAQSDRARHLLGDVERALLLQILAQISAAPADPGAGGDPGPGRERRGRRYRRRPGGGLQDREPQPSELHRALSGGGDRRRRDHARRLHHGRPADRQSECAALRRAGRSQDPPSARRRGRRHRGLRQLHGRAHGGGRDQFPPRL